VTEKSGESSAATASLIKSVGTCSSVSTEIRKNCCSATLPITRLGRSTEVICKTASLGVAEFISIDDAI
jgi:hypothetical protein